MATHKVDLAHAPLYNGGLWTKGPIFRERAETLQRHWQTCSIFTRVTLVVCALSGTSRQAYAVDTSPPAILQWFESSWETMVDRSADLFQAGYGAVWVPPPTRGDTSDFTVGYDVYDRYDLGQWNKKTLYGTGDGLSTLADALKRAGDIDLHVDFIMNHNGYSDLSTTGFYEAGGYPGLSITEPNDIDGDFHSAFWGGPEYERLAGLVDIAHEKNFQFIRNPVDPNDSRNIRAGTTPAFGRIANVPDPSNTQFYPDINYNTIYVYDPVTGEQNIPIHSFNPGCPECGDAVPENATGYLMRSAQWLVQTAGVDGLRIDAGKHMQGFVFDFLDRAIYRSHPDTLLDGSPKHVFTYTEVYDANPTVLLPHVKKNIDPNDIGRIGGNRDTLDFKWYFAVKDNLEQYGQSNAWFAVKDAGLDVAHNGLHDGSAGVKFTRNHDVYKPYKLDNVANALMLMLPGNAVIYFNGKQFGDNRDFPKEGRSDALSVGGGSLLTSLLRVRETHGRGNYVERWVDNQGIYVFERESASLVGLSNRGDGGFDQRTVQVALAAGTLLVEQTGNASDTTVDPFNDIAEVLTVYQGGDGNQYVDIRVPRNLNANGVEHQQGYVVYGLGTPHSDNGLELFGTAGVLAGNTNITSNYENGIQRQSDISIVTGDSLTANLQTREVRHLGLDSLRDIFADGDNAQIKVDGGRDVNGNGAIDVTTPGDVGYGFEEFTTYKSPLIGLQGINGPRGDGRYTQDIDTTQLEEGLHHIEVKAYRHRTDGGPAVFSLFRKSFYLDRVAPDSGFYEFVSVTDGSAGDNDVLLKSLDGTADNMHVFMNLPASISDQEIYDYINAAGGAPDLSGYAGQTDQVDVHTFKTYRGSIPHGNNVFTLASFEVTGTSNIQRIAGLMLDNALGGGLGDLNLDGSFTADDIAFSVFGFEAVLYSQDTQFNPAADINGDGRINTFDLLDLEQALTDAGAAAAALDALAGVRLRRIDFTDDGLANSGDWQFLAGQLGGDEWLYDLNADGVTDSADLGLLTSGFGIIPEPSSGLLLGLGGLILACLTRRNRRGFRTESA